jgi:hypothetical protein
LHRAAGPAAVRVIDQRTGVLVIDDPVGGIVRRGARIEGVGGQRAGQGQRREYGVLERDGSR